MFDYLPEDGYANNVNYNRVSSNFPYYHRNIYGLSNKYKVSYIDSLGSEQRTEVALFSQVKDTTKKSMRQKDAIKRPRVTRAKKLLRYRSFVVDSTGSIATMTLNTFSEGRLRTFSGDLWELKQKISTTRTDLRSNGGGKVAASTLLTKYVSRKRFKYRSYMRVPVALENIQAFKGGVFNSLELLIIAGKRRMENTTSVWWKRNFTPQK